MAIGCEKRQDLPQYNNSRGGGVFVLIKDDIIGVCQVSIERDCEIVWVKFDIVVTKSVLVASVYCGPNEKDMVSVEELEKSLSKICNKTNSHIWIGGNFN